jgi:hypothetical protein
MYKIGWRDRVTELTELPQQSTGAPTPLLLADDGELVLAYRLATEDDETAIVEFDLVRAHYFGPPNDEAMNGHPLYKRGLRPYAAQEVHNSSWIRALERMNRVHPSHSARMYERCRHFIFTFHDTAFECIADGIKKVSRIPSVADLDILAEMRRRLPTQIVSRVV